MFGRLDWAEVEKITSIFTFSTKRFNDHTEWRCDFVKSEINDHMRVIKVENWQLNLDLTVNGLQKTVFKMSKER